ncbi:Calx-beta domain-containing protein, partial [Lutibacter oricola]
MNKQLLKQLYAKNTKFRNLFTLLFFAIFFLSFQQHIYSQDATINVDGVSTICEGESATIEVIIGASINPYTIVYSDGTSNYTVTNYNCDANIESPTYGGDPITVAPTVTTTYSLVSVIDQFNISLPINSSTVTITVNPLPSNITATVNSGNAVCYNSAFIIDAAATDGNTYELWNEANSVKLGDLPYNATITENTNYTIRALSASLCESTQALSVSLENIVPTITGEGNKIINTVVGDCNAILPDYRNTVTVTDNCSSEANITLIQNPVPGSIVSNHNSVQPVVITATDEAGNENTYNFNVTLIDNVAPEITCVGNQPVAANNGCSYEHSGTAWDAVGNDNCTVASVTYNLTGATTGSGTTLNSVAFLAGTTTVTWTVTDGAGLTNTCSFDVIISDSENPTVSCVSNQTRNTSLGNCNYTHTSNSWNATALDNCGTPAVSYVLTGATNTTIPTTLNGATFNKGVTNVEVTVTDGALNTDTCSFSVIINDAELPLLVDLPNNILINNDVDACNAIVSWVEPTATDNCSVQTISYATSPTAGLTIGSAFPIGTTNVTYTVADDTGNENTGLFNIVVSDSQYPEITCPTNITQNVEAGTCGATINYITPVGTDNCVGVTTSQIAGLASGSVFPEGTTVNTFEVTDASGNKTSCSFNVTIVDNEIPIIVNCPLDITQNNDLDSCNAVVSWTEPTVSDNCTNPASITWEKSHTPGTVFPVGTTIVTYTAKDEFDNVSATCSFNVTVVDAQLPEIIGCPSNITKTTDLDSCNATVSWTEPSVNDNCTSSANIVWTKSHTPGTVFSPGTTTVTYVATDEAGNNSVTCSFDVVVEDSQKPVITNCPTTITQNTDSGLCTAAVSWVEPSASDNCTVEGNLVWTKSHLPGSSFNVGTTTVTYTVTDEAGNISNVCSFDVIVSDNQNPNAVCISPTIYLNASGVATLTVADVNNASSDNCTNSEDLVITLSKTTFNCSNKGNNTVVMTVKDASGNTSTCNSTVVVADNIAPTLTATAGTADSSLNVDISECSYTVKGSELDPMGADNCTSGITLLYEVTGATTLSGSGSLTGQTLLKGVNVIEWTASDGTNSSAPLTFTKTVVDNQSPSVSTVGNQYKGTDSDACGYTVNGTEFDATYSDNCLVNEVTYKINSSAPVVGTTLDGVLIMPGINTIVWTVSDGVNSKSSSFRVTVTDDTLPIISKINDITEEIDTGCGKIIGWAEPTASDNCTLTSFTQTEGLANGTSFPVGLTKVTYTVEDSSGNIVNMSFNVTISDLTPPELTCPSGSTELSPFNRDANTGLCFYEVIGAEFDPTTTDGCAFTAATNSFDGTTTLQGKELPVGDHTITWTAVDEFDNISTCTIYVRINDTQNPTFDQSTGNFDKYTDPAQCYYTIVDTSFDLRNIADNCGLQDPTYIITKGVTTEFTGTNTLAGIQLLPDNVPYSVEWTVEDVNGNTVVADAFTITVLDNQAPTFECYGNEIRNIPSTVCDYTVVGTEFDPSGLTDNCDASGDLTISYTLNGVSGGASTSLAGEILTAGVHAVVWTIKDSKENEASCSFNITVVDPVTPTISAVLDQTRNAPTTSCSYITVGAEFDPVTVTDNCPSYTLTNNLNGLVTLDGYEFPVGITVVVWTVTDSGGNIATTQYQVDVNDVTSPEYNLTGNTDAVVSITKSTSSTDCYYTAVGTEFDPQAITDNCTSANYTVINDYNSYRSLAYVKFPVGTTNVSWSVKDNYGNETIKTLQITVVDDVKPVINCPSSDYTRVYGIGQNYYVVGTNEFKPVVTENCSIDTYEYVLSGATTGSGTNLTGVQLNEGVNTIVWTATDSASPANIETCTITVNVVSDLYPAITCVGDQSKNTDTGECFYTVSGTEFNAISTTAGATLINDYNSSSTLDGAVFPQGTTLVTWTASQTVDGTEYTNDCSFYVIVSDNEDPVITAPANLTRNTNSGCFATNVNLGTPVVSDNCGVLNVWNNQIDATYNIGVTTVTWYVEDIHGNRVSTTQTVTVVDDDAPTLNCITSICREVDEGQNYYTVYDHEFNPYGIYDCSTVTVTNDYNGTNTLAGEQIAAGTTVVNWTITDTNNNVTNCTTTITINTDDPPSVTCRGFQRRPTDPGVCTYIIQNTELDISSTTPTTVLTYTLSGATTGSGSTTLNGVILNKGVTTVSWTATNGSDTNVCCTYNIHVYDDQFPVVTWPADITVSVDAGSSCTATGVDVGVPTATDNCDAPAAITYTQSTNDTTFNLGETNIYWRAKDARGNYVYHTQKITVTDDISPVIDCPTETYYREYTHPYVDYYYIKGDEFTPSVTDNCVVTSYTNSLTGTRYINGQHLNIGDHIITWTAEDGNPGTPNTATCNVNVTVVDSFKPIIDCPNNNTEVTNTGSCSYTIPLDNTDFDATFTSISGDARTMTHNLVGAPSNTTLAGASIPKGVNTITWTATQTIGGTEYTNSCEFTFTVNDEEAPELQLPFDDVTVNVDPGTCTNTFTLTPPTVTDNCSAVGDITITNNAPATFLLGTTNVRWQFTDEEGNQTVYVQKVTVYDNESPIISNCPSEPITAKATGNNCQVNVSWPALVATDDCAGVKSFISTHNSGSIFSVGTTTVTYTATDNNDNVSTCSFDVVVTDTAPTLTCIEDQTRSADAGTCEYKVLGNEFDLLAFDDNCTTPLLSWSFIHPETLVEVTGTNTLSGVSIPRGHNNGATTGQITITWTATDSGGKENSCSFVLTITDDEAPILVVPGNQIRSTDLHKNYYTVKDGEFDDVTATDNCGIVTKIVNEFGVATLDDLQMQMGENSVTWEATDDSGNVGSANFYAYIVDTELPRLENAPSSISVDAGASCNAKVDYTPPTFIDNVTAQEDLVITISPSYAVPDYEFPVGITEVSYIVVDESGNILTYSFDITVTDNLSPTLNCPLGDVGNQFNRNTDTNKAYYTGLGNEFNPTNYSDNCIVTLENDYNNTATLTGSTFPIGITTVVWTATDESDNSTSCTIQVVVTDIEQPVINSCADVAVTREADLGSCFLTVTSSEFDPFDFKDNAGVSKLTYSIDGAPEVGTDVNTTLVGAQIPVGITNVIWRLYDLSNNVSATCTTAFTITDTQLPNLIPIATQTRNVNAGLSTYEANSTADSSWNIAVTDNCTINTITYQIDGGAIVGTDALTSIMGETFTVGTHTVVWTATDIYGNSNTGFYQVIVEDNEAPTTVCNPITVNLDNTGSYSLSTENINAIALGSSDPSGIATFEVSPNSFDCVDVGTNRVTLTVTDNYGNVATCDAIVTVADVTPPTALCKPVTLYLDVLGNATILASDINNGSNDACGIASISASKTSFDCTNVGVNTVTLTVTDVNGNSSTCDTTVTIEDDVNPVAVCKNITVSLDINGEATITGLDIDNGSYDNCLSTLNRVASPNTFNCSNIGANEVVLTVTDPAGNSDTCSAIVTVEDTVIPTVICQDITIQLDASGNATITANDIDNGSTDACGITSLSLDKTNFDCSNIGANPVTNTVTLTVTDTNNNVATCTALVTVEDKIEPLITCTSNKVVDTDANECTYTHNNSTWNAIATDACTTISSLTYALSGDTVLADNPANRDLNGQEFNKGTTTVTWTVIDGSGNSNQCTFDVVVEDNQLPNAICQNITIQLDALGNASINENDINNGSNDNCGILSIVASKTDFTCADFGANTVTLTVTDTNNNVSMCNATVTVEDSINPVAACTPITIQLNSAGNYSLSAADINTISAGSSDNCSISTREVFPNTFSCSDIGTPVNVTLTVTDIAGRTNICSTTVTVVDNVLPNAICQNITIPLDADGNASITGNDIDGGSTDVCGISSRVASKTAFTCADLGNNTVTLTVTDVNGNVATCDATVEVVDTRKPTFTLCSTNQTEVTDPSECTHVHGNTDWNATATDNCGVVSLTYSLSGVTTGTGTDIQAVPFNKGTTTVTWTATDASGNSETCSYTVTVNDTEDPQANCKVANVELERDGTVTVLPSIINDNSTDNCGITSYEISKDGTNFNSSLSYNCSEISGNTIYLKVTDDAGLTDVCSTTITIDDTQAPTLDDLTNRNEVVDSGVCTYTHPNDLWNPTDNCDISPTITYTLSGATTVVTGSNTTLNGQIFETGTTTVTWTVADHSIPINSDTVTFDVVVADTQNPTIFCPSNITQDVENGGDTSVEVSGISAPIYSDNCAVTKLTYALSGATTVSAQASGINELSSATFNIGTTTVTYIVYDEAGNSETCNFNITVNALPDNTIIVSETAITTTEDLGTDTFTVVLPFAPTGTVVFNVESDDLTEGTVDKSTLTFNESNWDTPQTVTVTGVNDDVDDGDISYTIILTTNTDATDDLSGYENVNPADVSAINLDNDTAGVTVSVISAPTTESGGTATFTVVLDTEPTNDVTITLTSDDLTESLTSNLSTTTLTFTAGNWDEPQTVTVTGEDDEIVDGNVSYNIVTNAASSGDSNYNGENPSDVAVVNNDNDTAGFIVTPITSITTEDGGQAIFTIELTSQPATDSENYEVVVDVIVDEEDTTEGTVDLELTFDHTNWNVPQTVTVTGLDDAIVDGTISYSIENKVNTTKTTDSNYDVLNPDDVTLTNTDNDAATLAINSVSINEGSTVPGTTAFDFTVTKTGPDVVDGFTVSFYASNGTALAGIAGAGDFTGTGGQLNFGETETTKTITVLVNQDEVVEANEEFTVVLSLIDPNSLGLGMDVTIPVVGKTGTGTIQNDDSSAVSINDVSIVEQDSGQQTLTFTVSLSLAVEENVTVDYTTTNGTATTVDSDYVANSGTLTFIGGDNPITEQTIEILINGDEKVELDETFNIVLSNQRIGGLVNPNLTIAKDTGVGTITNDDAAQISISGFTVNEAVGTADFTITMDKTVQTAFTIDFATSDDSALAGSDYTAVTSTLNFGGANALTQTVTVPITNDTFVEPTENLFGTISNLVDAANQNITFNGGGASAQATGVINDAIDAATISINDMSVNEADGTATFTVTLTGDIQDDLTVDYTAVNIDALSGSDYTLASGTVTFAGGSTGTTTQSIIVTILNDVIAEPTETYYINLSNISSTGSASFTDSDYQGLGTIIDNDPLALTISEFTITETESTQVDNFVVRSNIEAQEDIIITFTTSDVETSSGSDYVAQSSQSYTLTAGQTSVNIPISILGDIIAEPIETFTGTIALSEVNGQNVSITTAIATSTINDNDIVHITLEDKTVVETNGTQLVNYIVSTDIASENPIVLDYSTFDGTALNGVLKDYTTPSYATITIPAGQTTLNIPIDVLGDSVIEPTETYTASISENNYNGQQVDLTKSSATYTITDNDSAELSISGFTINESEVGTVTANFTVTLSSAVQNTFTVDFATSNIINQALAGSDYTAVATTTLTFGATNDLVQTVEVIINNDDLVEPTETLLGTISNLVANNQNVTISTPTAIGTITDNDAASVVINNVEVAEDVASGTAIFTVTLTGHIQDNLTVDYTTTNGAATNPAVQPSDYTLTTGTVTFMAGSNTGDTQTIIVPIIDNSITEPLNEYYTVDLSNIVSTGTATINDSEGLGTIVDDDPLNAITLTGFNNSETNSNSTYNFVATLDYLAQEPIIISFTTTNDTAVGTDFIAQNTVQYTIPANTLSVNIPVVVIGDLISEPQESFTGEITLVNDNDQHVTIGTNTATSIINDDDNAIISIAGFTVNEDVGTAEFTITSSLEIQNEVTVIFSTSNGSALSSSDYDAVTSTTLTFGGSNSNPQTVSVNITDDIIAEPTELFSGILSSLVNNSQNVTLSSGPISSAVGTIRDNDEVTLSIDDITLIEVDGGATVNYQFTVTHIGLSTDGPFSVNYLTSNVEALAGLDYVANSGTINFSGTSGETQTITIVVNGDDILEPTETFTVDLSENDFGGRLITFSDASGLGTITDNDVTTVSIVANDPNAAEPNNNGQFTVSIGQASSTATVISYAVTGTANSAEDYVTLTETVTIPAGSFNALIDLSVINNDILEASETVIITLNAITSGDANISIGTPEAATVTIADDDSALISISANDAIASEPGNNGQFTINTSNVSDVDTVIEYLITGTATATDDYTALTGTVTIPAGETSVTINVNVVNDNVLEASETVIVTLNSITSGDADASIDTNNDEATVTIADNNSASLAVEDITVVEGNNAVFTVTLTGNVQGGFSINYATNDGTATTFDSDYTVSANTLTFTGTDAESYTITVLTNDDDYLEVVENFMLNLSGISNVLVSYDNQAIATLNDNDSASLSVSDVIVDEGNNAVFTVVLNGNVQGGVSVDYSTANNSALSSSDYVSTSGTLNFTGTTPESFTITIPTSEDLIAEPLESFELNFESISNSLVSFDTQAIGTITDDDFLSIRIADNTITETDVAQVGYLVVTMNGVAQSDVVLSFSTVSGTALPTTDYISESGDLVVIPSGSTGVNIPINILGDLVLEPTESFTGTISISEDNGQPITILDGSSNITIIDNDAASVSIANVSVDEDAGVATFAVTLTGDVQDSFTVNYATSNNTSAIAGLDYTATTGTVSFLANSADGATETFTVAITDDSLVESTETYTVTLSGITGLATISEAVAIGTIVDDDASAVSIAATNQASEPNSNGLFTVSLTNAVSTDT